jgi:hypothetical protein
MFGSAHSTPVGHAHGHVGEARGIVTAVKDAIDEVRYHRSVVLPLRDVCYLDRSCMKVSEVTRRGSL